MFFNTTVEEGETKGTRVTKYDAGEILLPPASRADLVAVIPNGLPPGEVLTLWTRNFQRTGGGNPRKCEVR